jgi:hypothetical protein
MVLSQAADDGYPLLELFWTMLIFFGFAIWMWLLFLMVLDVFRREDIGGWGKAGWTLLLIVTPLVGVLVYLIAQGEGMTERHLAGAYRTREDFEPDARAAVSDGRAPQPADQIVVAKRLRDDGDITAEEYEVLKRRVLGLPAPEPVHPAR